MVVKNKKILLSVLFGINFMFSMVATQDVHVMSKDSTQAMNVMGYYTNLVKDINSQKETVAQQKNALATLEKLSNRNNQEVIKRICAGCSDTTVQELEDWRAANAKNICDELNNQLGLIRGHITNIGQMDKLLENLKQAMSGDPTQMDFTRIGAAFSSASNATLTEMNQTQQQLANYNLQKDQNQQVEKKLSEVQMKQSLFGSTSQNKK